MSNILLICDKPGKHANKYDLIAYWESFDESNGATRIHSTVVE